LVVETQSLHEAWVLIKLNGLSDEVIFNLLVEFVVADSVHFIRNLEVERAQNAHRGLQKAVDSDYPLVRID